MEYYKKWFNSNGKQKYSCKDCRRQFVENPENKRIAPEIWDLVDRLLLEKISIAGTARVVGISELWLQKYINVLYQNISKIIELPYAIGKIILECDEMWSFVGTKENKQWIWLAIDRNSRKIVGVHVGSRDRKGSQALWDSLPQVYRECDVCYTDFWSSYNTVIPDKCHKAVGKETGETNHIERFIL
ncbi:MAG: IS1 family transposase [Desulfamplus sp.]|nr:IS1 family transposase [Desulfamplus sp.]